MTVTTITGIASMLFGLIYGYGAYTLPRAPVGSPMAPSIFPMILGAILTLLGAILLVKEQVLRKKGKADSKASFSLSHHGKLIAFTAAWGVIYALLFERLGYVLSTFLFLSGILFLLNGRKKWVVNIVVAGIFSLGIYIVFSNFLGIQLPKLPFVEI